MRENRLEHVLEGLSAFTRLFEQGSRRGHPEVDYLSRDGREALNVMANIAGSRDLHAAVTGLATHLLAVPELRTASLLALSKQLTAARAEKEMDILRKILHPTIARRIEVVLVGADEVYHSTPGSRLAPIAEELRKELSGAAADGRKGNSLFEIHKLLLRRVLLGEPAPTLRDLAEMTGYSYSAVSDGARKLQSAGTTRRGKKGTIELQDVSLRKLAFLAQMPGVRPVRLLVDATGRKPDHHALWKRVRPWLGESLAAGGVLAGEHWDPKLDLHGLPRIDLHAVDPRAFKARELGLADAPAHVGPERVVVALHPVIRKRPLFIRTWADPVETILDLLELRLQAQAEQLLGHLRGRRR